MNYLRPIVRSSVARVTATIASMAVSFFMVPLVVRTFGDHWYGLLVIAGGVSNYYHLFDFGLSTAASRFVTVKVAQDDERGVNEAVSTAFVIFSVLGVGVLAATLVACVVARGFADPQDYTTLRTIILLQGGALALGFPIKAYGGIVFSQLRHDLLEAFTLVQIVVETTVIIYLLTHGFGVVAYALVGVASGQIYNLFFYYTAIRLWPRLKLSSRFFRRDLARGMFGYSAWATVNQFSDSLRFKIDSLVIAGYAGASMVAHYNIGARLSELSTSLIFRATNFMAPLYTRYHAQGETEELQAKFFLFTRINTLLATAGGGILIVLGDAFIVRWMGPRYRDAYPVLVALMLGMIVEAILTPASNVLYGVAKHRTFAIASSVEAVANVVLSLVLVHRFGIVGVACGTTIPLLVNKLIFVPLYTSRVIGIRPRQFYMCIIPAATMSAGVAGALYLAIHLVASPSTYGAIAAAAAAPVLPIILLSFMFLLTSEERVILTDLVTVRFARLRSA